MLEGSSCFFKTHNYNCAKFFSDSIGSISIKVDLFITSETQTGTWSDGLLGLSK